jgi:AcrR family transcriptional regulator
MDNDSILDHEKAELILEEGWLLFQQKGYRGVTVDELCLRCQLTKPTLYYYFRDKENLFVSVLQFKLHGFRTAAEQPGTLAERLENVAAVILNSFITEYSSLMRDREHIKDPENQTKIRNAFRGELFEPLNSIMLTGLEQGALTGDRPETLTLLFLGMINNFIGKAVEMKIQNSALARTLTRYFLKGAEVR